MPIFQTLSTKLVYLASPYSHTDGAMMHWRYTQARDKVSEMIKQGQWVYSPIVHNHFLEDLGRDWSYWEEYDLTILDRCDELHVLCLEGWEISKGVTGERQFAGMKGIPVQYVNPVFNGSNIMPIARRII